jgi:hypothetical protein
MQIPHKNAVLRCKGEYLIELAEILPHRNINFYIDACRAMCLIHPRHIPVPPEAEAQFKKILELVIGPELKEEPHAVAKAVINYLGETNGIDTAAGMKLLGKMLILYLRRGEFKTVARHRSTLPYDFLSFALVEDLKLNGQGPRYSLVEKFLDELAGTGVISLDFHGLQISQRCSLYAGGRDIATVFLGYSMATTGALLPIVPFPRHPVGFVARLLFELKSLLPCGAVKIGPDTDTNRAAANASAHPRQSR